MIVEEAGWRWGCVQHAGATLLLAVVILLEACSSPLPEPDSPTARLYVKECGTCHAAYPPHLLRPAMWRIQVERMADLRRRKGMPPLTAVDERAILDYLTRHAG
jgi:hypothetical protein